VKKIFVFRGEANKVCKDKALEIFYQMQLHSDVSKSNVLIAYFQFDRRVEIVADVGILKCESEQYWQDLVSDLLHDIKNNHSIDGITKAIAKITALHSTHFPKS
jgi:uncharacterized membrane protein